MAGLALTGCGPTYTKAQYDKVQNGQTLAQVQAIMGGAGDMQSETKVSDTVGQTWQWANGEGTGVIVTFENGKVSAKGQRGLQ